MSSSSGIVSLSSHNLSYQIIGSIDATDQAILVFLHEGLGSIAQWKEFPQALCNATGLSGLIYERRGYGKSSPLESAHQPNYLELEATTDLPQLIQALSIESPLILVGHSDGGSIALVAATHLPNVKGIITEAAHVFVEDLSIDGIRKTVEFYQKSPKLHDALARYHFEHTDATFWSWADIWLSNDFRDWNIERYLPNINCPSLIVQGKDDEYGTPAQVEAIVQGIGDHATAYLVPDCGHAPHHQQAELVLHRMAAFIQDLLQ